MAVGKTLGWLYDTRKATNKGHLGSVGKATTRNTRAIHHRHKVVDKATIAIYEQSMSAILLGELLLDSIVDTPKALATHREIGQLLGYAHLDSGALAIRDTHTLDLGIATSNLRKRYTLNSLGQRITHTALKILLCHSKGGHQYKNNKYKWKSFHNRAKITKIFVYLPSEEFNTLT